jgi:membrane carboxypeptidase/penicillin-binding protein
VPMKFKGDPSQDFTIIENLDDRAGKTVFRAKLKQTEIEVAVKRIDVKEENKRKKKKKKSHPKLHFTHRSMLKMHNWQFKKWLF